MIATTVSTGVVVLVGVDDQGRAVVVLQATLAGERRVARDLGIHRAVGVGVDVGQVALVGPLRVQEAVLGVVVRSEEHTSELQSH